MAKRKKRYTGRQRLVQILIILVFCGAAVLGGFKAFVRPPDIPPVQDGETPSLSPSDGEETTTPDTETEKDPDTETEDKQEIVEPQKPRFTPRPLCFNILVAGLDNDNGGSDTNILVQIDAEAGVIHATSLPRDTLINTDWTVKKLNGAYNVGGIERVQKEVSNLLGIPVHYYITVDLQGFVELVNAIGGVDFDIPIDMDYDDPVQDLHIQFKAGPTHLDGEDALKVVRFRHNNDGTGYGTEDIGRIGTQQAFLKAVAKKMLGSISAESLNSYSTIFANYVKTDLTVGNLVWIATQAMTMGLDNIHFHTLPGDGAGLYEGRSYYVLDAQATLELVNVAMNPYHEAITMDDLDIIG